MAVNQYSRENNSGLSRADFLVTIDGKQVDLYVLKNKNGLEMCVTNFGGIVVSLLTPDRDGNLADIVLGHDNMHDYLNSPEKFLGAAIGRVGNRLRNCEFTLDGVTYHLDNSRGAYTLHGGKVGFNNRVWDAVQTDEQTLELTYVSPDGEEGFPGTLTSKMVYKLNDENEFYITYEAETDKPTIVNLTHHSFFNLSGEGNPTICDHVVTINADNFTPASDKSIPTGEIITVEGTPMDFRTPFVVGDRIDDDYDQLIYGIGYDHNYVLNKTEPGELSFAARVVEPKSGRAMDVITTEPGMQLYAGNWLNGFVGKKGHTYPKRSAICFETQHFPDSQNVPHFPSTVLRPGEKYTQTCIYKFDTI